MADTGWSQQEIDASVEAYVQMLQDEITGRRYNKAAVNRELREGPLTERSRGSIEMRMCNISTVLNDQGKRYIDGYKPRENVGANVYPMIQHALARHSGLPSGVSSYKSLPDEIPTSFIQDALTRIDRSGISPHSDSSTYDVVHEGRKYPPIAVVAFALEALTGQPVAAGTIRGGRGTQAFKLLAAAGFDPVPKYFEPSSDNQQLEERVEAIRQNEPLDLPPEGNRKPAKRRAPGSEVVERDPQVKRWVLDTAAGTCELCGERSPFHSKAPGHPLYLEVHHVVPLKKDGPDTVCNAVALCPNCHTRCHQSVDAADATGMLYERVGRLVRRS